MNLSPLAEKQLNEIQYAFETVSDDQIYNHLETDHSKKFTAWMIDNKDKRVKLESN